MNYPLAGVLLFLERLDPLNEQPDAIGIGHTRTNRRHLSGASTADARSKHASRGGAGRNNPGVREFKGAVLWFPVESGGLLERHEPIEIHRAISTAVKRVAVGAIGAEIAASANVQRGIRVICGNEAREMFWIRGQQR